MCLQGYGARPLTPCLMLLPLAHCLSAGGIRGGGQQHFILLVLCDGGALCHAVGAPVSEFLLAVAARAPHQGFDDEITQLRHVQNHADGRRRHHEDGEDGLLGRPGDEAVDLVGARPLLALHQPGHLEAVVHKVQRVHEASLEDEAEEQAAGVRPPQGARDRQTAPLQRLQVHRLLCAVGGEHRPLVPSFPVGHVHGHQQGRRGHKDELQAPQADVRHGEKVVVADILAARLLRVAREVGLLVSPDALGSQDQDGDAKDEEDGKPDLSQAGGVFVDSAQLGVKGPPAHCGEEASGRSDNL